MRFHCKVCLLLTLGALLLTPALAAGPVVGPPSPTPEPFDGYVVAMANGIHNPAEFFVVGDAFLRDVMSFSSAEIADLAAEADAFFQQRFGAGNGDPGWVFFPFYFGENIDYRVHTFGGRRVPPEGWPMRDGGFALVAVDPAGVTLGGDFAGLTVPAGTVLAFGFYKIQIPAPGPGAPAPEPIVFHYRSADPMLTTSVGTAVLGCEIFSDELGSGTAQGIASQILLPDGTAQANFRNVMTFER